MYTYEQEALKRGFNLIAGVDEVGRGPLAGPVVAAAVEFPFSIHGKQEGILNLGIRDSKTLTRIKRECLCKKIFEAALSIGLGIIWPDEIEKLNIHIAAQKAMTSAVKKLMPSPDFLIIDGLFKIPSNIEQLPVVKGDALSISVAAASIIAKVARDRIMEGYRHLFPEYQFERHKGYPTKEHLKNIMDYGPSSIHRKCFKGVREHV